jgi:hypothetical protein
MDESVEDESVNKSMDESVRDSDKVAMYNTHRLMLFALEKSGTGPQGCMGLDLPSVDETSTKGAIAYVRAFIFFCEEGYFSQFKVSNVVPSVSTLEIDPDWKLQCSILEPVGTETYDEYKILCSPMLLFLHIDQGVEQEVVTYAPFATPKVNCRAINSSHISRISNALKDGEEAVTTSGDYSIFPFEVDVGNSTASGTRYSSVLTRDPGSHYISGKLAVSVKIETVQSVRRTVRTLWDYHLVSKSSCRNPSKKIYFCTFPTMQFLGEDVPTLSSGDSRTESSAKDVSELFHHLAKFLEIHFKTLTRPEDWTVLYSYLVHLLVKDFNGFQEEEKFQIEPQDILIPRERYDLLMITRLLYQAIVPIRVAVADGQHRLLSLMNVLLGFRVCDSLSKSPPIYFEMADQFRPPYSYWQSKMWNGLAKKCTVRLAYAKEVMPFDENFERLAQEYSKRRDTEQAHTRLRSLWDV